MLRRTWAYCVTVSSAYKFHGLPHITTWAGHPARSFTLLGPVPSGGFALSDRARFRSQTHYTVNVRMRPFSVLARVTIPAGGAEGVLIAQGGAFAGWTLFVKDGRLIYEHNYVGVERYRLVSTETLPEGDVALGMEFKVTGSFEIAPDLTAMGTMGEQLGALKNGSRYVVLSTDRSLHCTPWKLDLTPRRN